MALYLSEGSGSNRLLGLTCRHVLIGSQEGNADYVRHHHGPPKNVVLLGKRAYTDLVDSIMLRIGRHGISIKRWKKQIEGFQQREEGTDERDVARAAKERTKTQALVDAAEEALEALAALLSKVETHWKKLEDRVLGTILRCPPIRLGVGSERFTEDWGVFSIDRSKLGDGFQGNKIDLGAFELPAFYCLLTQASPLISRNQDVP